MIATGVVCPEDSKERFVGAEEEEPRAESTLKPAESQKLCIEGSSLAAGSNGRCCWQSISAFCGWSARDAWARQVGFRCETGCTAAYLVGGLQKVLELSEEMGVHGRVSAKHDRSTYLGLGRGRFGRWEKYHVKSRHKCSSVLIDETMAFRVQDGGVGRMPGTAGTSSV